MPLDRGQRQGRGAGSFGPNGPAICALRPWPHRAMAAVAGVTVALQELAMTLHELAATLQ
eukprot:3509169-Heterocapsa_arctica.AAC.1